MRKSKELELVKRELEDARKVAAMWYEMYKTMQQRLEAECAESDKWKAECNELLMKKLKELKG